MTQATKLFTEAQIGAEVVKGAEGGWQAARPYPQSRMQHPVNLVYGKERQQGTRGMGCKAPDRFAECIAVSCSCFRQVGRHVLPAAMGR